MLSIIAGNSTKSCIWPQPICWGKVRGCGMAEIGPFCVARVVPHLPSVIGPRGLCLRWKEAAGWWERCSAGVTLLSCRWLCGCEPSTERPGRSMWGAGMHSSPGPDLCWAALGPELTEQLNRACSSAGITLGPSSSYLISSFFNELPT